MDKLTKRFPRYSRLLRLYPPSYQAEYGEQMLQTLADMLDNAQPGEKWRIWLRTGLDFSPSIIKQQLSYEGGIMANQMPSYIKRNGLIGAGLVAPFFVFVIINSFIDHDLSHSLVWHTNVLFTWLVILPGLAVILNAAALLRWLLKQRPPAKTSLWRRVVDLRHNWPAIGVVIVGLGILLFVFGHDSVHCITGNPLHEVTNWQQTSQCIQRS